MSLFDLLGKRGKDAQPPKTKQEQELDDIEIYSGMRVEVTTFDGRLLFVAKLLGPHGNQAELHQYSECDLPQDSEPLHVRIRGYSDHDRKAVYMEGRISFKEKHVWLVEELTVARVGNERAFFRLSTNCDATATMFSGLEIGEKPCKLLNISVGGACIGSDRRYHKDDKFLLKVRLQEDKPESVMFCQVLRIIEKENGTYEYGCCFLELTESDQEKIVQNIFTVQRQQRNG